MQYQKVSDPFFVLFFSIQVFQVLQVRIGGFHKITTFMCRLNNMLTIHKYDLIHKKSLLFCQQNFIPFLFFFTQGRKVTVSLFSFIGALADTCMFQFFFIVCIVCLSYDIKCYNQRYVLKFCVSFTPIVFKVLTCFHMIHLLYPLYTIQCYDSEGRHHFSVIVFSFVFLSSSWYLLYCFIYCVKVIF